MGAPRLHHLAALLTCSVVACADPDSVSLSKQTGPATSLGTCHCRYDDETHGDPAVQVTCATGGAEVEQMTLFWDPRLTGTQSVIIQFDHDTQPFNATGVGTWGALGEKQRADPNLVVRSLTGAHVEWNAQETCHALYGCDGASYQLAAGSLNADGACEDFWATIDADLSSR